MMSIGATLKRVILLACVAIGLLVMMSFAIVSNLFAQESGGRFISRWLALGPFIEGELAPKAIEVDYLLAATGIPESQFATLAGASKAGDSVTLTLEGYATQERIWKVLELPENGDVNAMLVEEGKVDFALVYLLTFIQTEEEARRVLRIGSDDSVKVWLNGEAVHAAATGRALKPDKDMVSVDLRSGMNCLMLKVTDSTENWGLAIRFEDESGLEFFDTPDGQPVPLGKRLIRLLNPQLETPKSGPGTGGVWETYQYVDGLADNYVRAILQDRSGIIWFGTRHGGVSQFDGRNWRTYTGKDGLASNWIDTIIQDREGAIWLGTRRGGISRFDGKNWKTYTEKDGLASDDVRAIMHDKEGAIWFGTGGGVNQFDGNNWKTYTQNDGLASDQVSALLQDDEGVIWFGTYDGVSQFDGKNWKTYTKKDGLAGDDVRAIAQDREGAVWFGTYDGVSQFDGVSWKTYTKNDGLAGNVVYAILQDTKGTMWFGTEGGGVSRFDGHNWKTYTQNNGLASDYVNVMLQDRESGIWFGTEGGGVSRLDEDSWRIYTKNDGLAGNDIRSIMQDTEGTMWFGTWDSGVSRFDGENWGTYTKEDGLAGYGVNTILQDDQGALWFGTSGVSRFDGKNWETYTKKDGLAGNHVRAMLQDKEGAMWFGTLLGGVSRLDKASLRKYTEKDGLAGKRINAILQDKKGAIWFGTYDGVSRFDGQEWETYTQTDGLADNRVTAIMEDKEGRIWFGTLNGVSQFDGRQWKTYTEKDGLASNWVNAVLQDKEGAIWFGTNSGGVSRFDGRCFQTIDSRDGLASDSVRCIYMDRSGQVWIGTSAGAVRFIPNKILPPVYITRVLTEEQRPRDLDSPLGERTSLIFPGMHNRVPPTPSFSSQSATRHPKLDLPVGVTRIVFDFYAISFKTRPDMMLYYYQLIGQDSDWQGPIRENMVEYSNLSPGKYTFKVQAVDRDLNYSDPPASVSIAIPAPPFHQTGVFLVVLSVIGGASLLGIIILGVQRWRLSHSEKLRLQQELEDARQMQLRLLPDSAPLVEGFDIVGFSQPAREVGGDFFDLIPLTDGKIGIALADVSGKGLKGAMNAVLASGMLREVAKVEESCGRILSALNKDLYPRMEKQMFTALGLAILDQDDRTLYWASAAQPCPIIRRQEQVIELKADGELPLGMMPNIEYPDWELDLRSGDIVIFYTDGIIEAENEAERMYGTERLEQVVTRLKPTMNAKGIIEIILQDVSDFVGDAEQYDDMTVVVVKKL